jgi:hypothetical protein
MYTGLGHGHESIKFARFLWMTLKLLCFGWPVALIVLWTLLLVSNVTSGSCLFVHLTVSVSKPTVLCWCVVHPLRAPFLSAPLYSLFDFNLKMDAVCPYETLVAAHRTGPQYSTHGPFVKLRPVKLNISHCRPGQAPRLSRPWAH